jgi:oligoribonuclease (3'-5' exoribonuclease)
MTNPYKKSVVGLNEIDVYRVLDLFEVKDHAIGHAIKKLLCAGKRGAKGDYQDVDEAIKSLKRWQEIFIEDLQREVK